MLEMDEIPPTGSRCDAQASPDQTQVEGIVVAIAHGFVEVSAHTAILLCTLRGRLRRALAEAAGAAARRGVRSGVRMPGRHGGNTRMAAREAAESSEASETHAPTRIVPGDRVRVTPVGGGTGVIEEIFPRRSALTRSAGESGGGQVMLANLDHAVLVFAVRDPAPHFGMLDRYLALAEHADVDVTICFNKVDLGPPPEVDIMAALYSGLGYRVLRSSAVTGEHLEELRARLCGRISLLTGPSGVGKSSLVNMLIPGAGQRTSALSAATGKGRHTTTGVRLLPLPQEGGGWLADSAGIRELALWNVPPEEVPRCFVELRPAADDCLFADCSHSPDEEGCALRAALAEGRITRERFASFERLLREARGEVSSY